MGQTLTHGIYLPDEGERNCYNGLAGNWQLLDGAVGTIAEHTSALAGKAPAVHTHTKSDITDFPAYGNTAGTICEGNDSRLSDARTPVAHTHTKADVTDLLNSNFIPSANNSYDLGSSSYQWNNLYAKRVNTQTLNGVNPGALSLPNLIMQTYDPNNGWYDLDTTDWDLTGSPMDISSNVLKDGYLYICLACDSTGYVIICEGIFEYPNCYYSTSGLPISGYARALLPVRKGTNVRLYLKGTSIYGARLFPALGNV